MRRTHQAVGLLVFVLLCLAVGSIGSLFTTPAIPGWYASLPRPPWTPPSWVFAPVWTFLYTLMAIAGWLVWRECGGIRKAVVPLAVFALQLALNLAWSIIFFGLQRVGMAFFEMTLLWLAILATLILFWRVRPLAGWLLLPYLLWVSYALTLNFSIWRHVGGW